MFDKCIKNLPLLPVVGQAMYYMEYAQIRLIETKVLAVDVANSMFLVEDVLEEGWIAIDQGGWYSFNELSWNSYIFADKIIAEKVLARESVADAEHKAKESRYFKKRCHHEGGFAKKVLRIFLHK